MTLRICLSAVILFCAFGAHAEKCVGASPCRVCKNCKYCAHCAPLRRGKGWENFRKARCGKCAPVFIVNRELMKI